MKQSMQPIGAKKTALVTGAGKRIGRAIALTLADNGFSIIVHYHTSKSETDDVCREISLRNVDAWSIKADLSKPRDLESCIDKALTCSENLSVLVNNASIFPSATLSSVTRNDFELAMRINAWAPLCLSRSFAQKAVHHGSIVNILDARLPSHDRYHVAYSLSKAALQHATRMCALEFAPHIRVNGVAPGLILPPAGKNMAYLKKLKDKVPLRTYGKPQDIADAVVFLVKSDFITGEIIHVDGGRHSLGYPV